MKEAITHDMRQPGSKTMSTHFFEDADHVSEKFTRLSQTGISILCNRSPVVWIIKKHNSVEILTFGSKFTALKLAVELVIALQYKLRMFGVPLEVPIDMLCDN